MATPRDEFRLATVLRPLLPWMTVIFLAAAAWSGWIVISRHMEAREAEEEAARRKANLDREVVERLGGDRLGVLAFYASPPAIRHGAHASLCYGVSNASKVAIEPGLGEWKPSLSRCIDVDPKRTTAYTLTAKSARGESVTATTRLIVQ